MLPWISLAVLFVVSYFMVEKLLELVASCVLFVVVIAKALATPLH
jgi:hypothetical protein